MILSNQARCRKCGDTPFSASRHDFKSCKCGMIFVDGGMDYLRRGAEDMSYIDDMSIEINDKAYGAAMENIRWALDTKRNELGILCAVARALRDNGVSMFDTPTGVPIAPNSDAEADLEQSAFWAANDKSVPKAAQLIVKRLWQEVVNRETAVVAQMSPDVSGGAITSA